MILPFIEQTALYDSVSARMIGNATPLRGNNPEAVNIDPDHTVTGIGNIVRFWDDHYNSLPATVAGQRTKQGVFTYHALRELESPGENHSRFRHVLPHANTIMPVVRCPSSRLPAIVPPTFSIPGAGNVPVHPLIVGYATTDYKGTRGGAVINAAGQMTNDAAENGIMHKRSELLMGRGAAGGPVTLRLITDGTSNTFLITESSYTPPQGFRAQNATADQNVHTFPAFGFEQHPVYGYISDWPTWIGSQVEDEQFTTDGRIISAMNAGPFKNQWYSPRAANNPQNTVGNTSAYSEHPGGANFAMADGSVRFVNQNIDRRTYSDLYSRNSANPISVEDL